MSEEDAGLFYIPENLEFTDYGDFSEGEFEQALIRAMTEPIGDDDDASMVRCFFRPQNGEEISGGS